MNKKFALLVFAMMSYGTGDVYGKGSWKQTLASESVQICRALWQATDYYWRATSSGGCYDLDEGEKDLEGEEEEAIEDEGEDEIIDFSGGETGDENEFSVTNFFNSVHDFVYYMFLSGHED